MRHRPHSKIHFFSGLAQYAAWPLLALLAGSAVPRAFAAEVEREAKSFSVITAGSVLQLLLSLLVIVALILALAWYARKMQSFSLGQSSAPLRVLAATAVGSKERVVLVQVGEEQLLLGVAPGQVSLLTKLDTPLVPGSTERTPASFIQHLRGAMSAGSAR